MEKALGPYCESAGLNKTNFMDKFPELQPEIISNGHIIEIYKYIESSSKVKWSEFKTIFNSNYQLDINRQTIQSSFKRVVTIKNDMIKSHRCDSDIVKQYLGQIYQPPKPANKKKSTLTVSEAQGPAPSTSNNTLLVSPPRKVLRAESYDLHSLKSENVQLIRENTNLKKENSKLLDENIKLKEQNQQLQREILQFSNSRTRAFKKRQVDARENWKGKYKNVVKVSKSAIETSKELVDRKTELKILKKYKTQQKKRFSQSKKNIKISAQSTAVCANAETIIDQKRSINSLKSQVNSLEYQLDLTSDPKESSTTKIDGKSYSSSIREASYHLQNFGVSQRNVSSALKMVNKALTDTDLTGSLPSYTTQNRFTKEMKAISRTQVKETLGNQNNLTLGYDGTTKRLGHLVGVQLQAKEGDPLMLGLTLQEGGTADEYVETIKSSCDRIDGHSSLIPSSQSNPIIQKVKNTISDRVITNTKTESKLQTLIDTDINTFKCAMHPLDAMAKDCDKVIKEYESTNDLNSKKMKTNYPFIHRGESNTVASVRVGSKLFHDTKYNCSLELSQYLKDNNFVHETDKRKSVLFERYVGNRFHVLFLSCGALYHYMDGIVDFFNDTYPPKNVVQTSVLNALQLDDIAPALRAMGIIGKVLTGPWMRVIANTPKILDMNCHFHAAYENLKVWSVNAKSLLSVNAKCAFNSAVHIKKDNIFNTLMKPSASDKVTISLLQDLCKACLGVMDRQLQSQLPGGKFWSPTPELKEQAMSTSSTSISVERIFSTSDSEIARAPSAKTGFIEAKVMYRRNKTGQWLSQMSAQQKENYIKHAKQSVKTIINQDRQDEHDHQNKIKQKLIDARKTRLEKEDRDRTKYEQWLENVYLSGGLWTHSQSVTDNLKSTPRTKSIEYLKSQINVRTKILSCTLENKFLISKCTYDELITIICQLISVPIPDHCLDIYELLLTPDMMVGRSFSQRWCSDDGKTVWYPGEFKSSEMTPRGLLDFKAVFDNGDFCHLSVDEILVDIIRDDLELFPV